MARLKPNNVSQGKLKSTGYTGEPTGTIEITENGIHNVKQYASADVQVPEPSGTINITENGTVDVAQYASANVNVVDRTEMASFISGTLTSYSNSDVTSLKSYAFYYDTTIKYVDLPNLVSTGYGPFYSSGVEEVNFPKLSNPGNACFRASKLKSISLPAWFTRNGSEVFRDCSYIEFADVRNLNNLNYYLFGYCPKLVTVVANRCTTISNYALAGTAGTVSALKNLIFQGRCTIGNMNAIVNTPFANGKEGGTVYTNYSNVSWYPTATNWVSSSANNQYKSIQENLIAIQALGVDLDGYYEIVEEKPASPTTDMVYLIATATPNEYTQHHWNGTSWNDTLPNITLGGNNGS